VRNKENAAIGELGGKGADTHDAPENKGRTVRLSNDLKNGDAIWIWDLRPDRNVRRVHGRPVKARKISQGKRSRESRCQEGGGKGN